MFRKSLFKLESVYEYTIYEKYKENCTLANDLIMKKNQNVRIFQIYDNLKLKNYRKSLEIHNKFSNLLEKNEYFRIISLFFSHFIKSEERVKYEIIKRPNNDNVSLDKQVLEFFEVLLSLESKGHLFHRDELFYVVEAFLYEKAKNEIQTMTIEEKEKNLIYHYFYTFLRPEEFIKY